jgi:hypothetical protein
MDYGQWSIVPSPTPPRTKKMEEKQISERESLDLISRMIQTAKTEQKDNGIGWIIWGWMLFLASVLTLLNNVYDWLVPWIFWNAFGVFTILAMLYRTIMYLFFRKTQRVKTYTKDLFVRLNIGFFISLMFIIFTMNLYVSPMFGFPLLMSLYAFWILIYGTALNFKPSIIGAYLMWAVAIIALFAKNFDQVMGLHALGVLVGYIIPGHIAYMEFKKLHRKDKVSQGV